ncbi:16S rRNA (cytidine(1402)-2'-O)-methyltransferase [Natroniella sulfidigena]|uniref:16S rRNA (cytidine(1402)-2'-O)-methyltransferase n=1 Tax=Natroniella sulfidigena TaxID=723921 RepID=UPI00200B2A37|nr:16S rRNA (cytidine(1402)-2'-O)-methyltransferase [Natroniella sulfidigena]MCK8817086.1 16S rRNA (cytidine(1402)-2'-O)-methyltransferase [Natroniella sulfidigena]
MSDGALYVCGTPIGNLADITLRALDTLKDVDLIAAEDTRRTQKLLNYYQIKTKLTSYHEHNATSKSKQLLSKIKDGVDIALVSDAGMPGISDPGYELIKLLRKQSIQIIPVPGPTAVTSSLVVSGLPTDRFVFEGFLPRKNKERTSYLERLKTEERTIVCYEAPHRLVATLKDILEILGDRQIVVCRELTKKFEEKVDGLVSEVLERFEEQAPKGEIAFVLEGNQGKDQELEGPKWEGLSILEHLKQRMKEGLTKKQAIKKVAQERDLPKSEVYQIGIKIKVDK